MSWIREESVIALNKPHINRSEMLRSLRRVHRLHASSSWTVQSSFWHSRGTPKLRIPAFKVSRSLATLNFVIKTNIQENLSNLTVSIMGGASVVIGWCGSCLYWTNLSTGSLRQCALHLSLNGKDLYYTPIQLSASTMADLGCWWHEFLTLNPGW